MRLKNILLALAVGGVLAGCASGAGRTVQADDLRRTTHFMTEIVIPDMDFPTLQRNLFRHREACGSAPRFVMQKGQTGYASLIETPEIPESYEDVVLADLTQYPSSWRSAVRVVVQFYSYYYNAEIQERADRMLAAVRNPGVCSEVS